MENITLFSLFLIGLSYGSTACMFSCMPFLTPLLITNSNQISASMQIMIPFSLGRVVTYIFIALIAYVSAIWIKDIINEPFISQLLLGGITILIALSILFNSFKSSSCCSNYSKDAKSKLQYFILGMAISLNPCIPVMTLITASINTTTLIEALSFGIVFGIGATVTSFLLFGFVLSKVAKEVMVEFAKYKSYIEKFAGVMLLIVGIFTIMGWR